jgi:hypothetical protein
MGGFPPVAGMRRGMASLLSVDVGMSREVAQEGLDRDDLGPGSSGENPTADGLATETSADYRRRLVDIAPADILKIHRTISG